MKKTQEGRGESNVISFKDAAAVRRPKTGRDRVMERVAQLIGERQTPRRTHRVITLKVSIQVPVGLEPGAH